MKLNTSSPPPARARSATARRSRHRFGPRQDRGPRPQGPARAQGRQSQGRLRRRPDAAAAPPAEGRLPLQAERRRRRSAACTSSTSSRRGDDRPRRAARRPSWSGQRASRSRSSRRARSTQEVRAQRPAGHGRRQGSDRSGRRPVAEAGKQDAAGASGNAASPRRLGKLTELRQRLFFVLGALVVFRLGSFIPVPGVNPEAMLAADRAAAGHDPGHVQHVLGRRAAALQPCSRSASMPYISASIIVQMMALDRAAAEGAAEGRRVRPAQDHAVHAHGHGRPGDLPGRSASRSRCRTQAPQRHAGGLHAGPRASC